MKTIIVAIPIVVIAVVFSVGLLSIQSISDETHNIKIEHAKNMIIMLDEEIIEVEMLTEEAKNEKMLLDEYIESIH